MIDLDELATESRIAIDKGLRLGHYGLEARNELGRLRAALSIIARRLAPATRNFDQMMRDMTLSCDVAREALTHEQTPKPKLCPGGLPCDTEQGCPYDRPACREAIERGHWSVKP